MSDLNSTALGKVLRAWRWWTPLILTCLLLSLVALPSWKAAQHNIELAEVLEMELEELEEWGEVSEEILEQVNARSRAADDRWVSLFPQEKNIELLFLDFARIADDCELREFHLEEIVNEMDLEEEDRYEMEDEEAAEDPDAAAMAAAELSNYRVQASFLADLGSTASFLDGLGSIPRAMQIRNIVIRDTGKGLLVEMEMELYVSNSTTS